MRMMVMMMHGDEDDGDDGKYDEGDGDEDAGDEDGGDVGEPMLTGQNAFPGQGAFEVGRNLIV